MASAYPGALDAFTTAINDAMGQGGVHPGLHNNANDAINKIEAELGVNPSGAFATVKLFLEALQLVSQKGVADGYAALDATGKVPAAQLPASAAATPSGAVLAFAGAGAPTGFLFCDGALVSRTTYAALFAVVGTTYGAGDGSTTFGLPDYRGRVLVGLNSGGPALINNIGDNDGRVVANRNISHHHSQDGQTFQVNGAGGTGGAGSLSAEATTGDANNPDYPAFQVIGWIIKT
jgi:hypothetical protein